MNFVDINTKKLTGINFANAVNEILYLTFWCFFSEIYISLINCDIAFCKLKNTFKIIRS